MIEPPLQLTTSSVLISISMPKNTPNDCKFLLPVCIVILASNFCQAQTEATVESDTATIWKTSKLNELDCQLEIETDKQSSRSEIQARKEWLSKWVAGSMTLRPKITGSLPKARQEPVLNSKLATEYRKRLNWKSTELDKFDFQVLQQALAEHPNDIGLKQLHLHWMDHPIRRKAFLPQINDAAIILIRSLKAQNKPDPDITRLATEFTLYRRGRAFAYRELPDVVKQTPIHDPKQLNRDIDSAFRDLTDASGTGRPEFILFEIRMLRRAGSFGTALSLLEKYGTTIKPQWYLKKRRDLLKELGWKLPYSEAARIYEKEFPQEVAKEKTQSAEAVGSHR